MDTTKKLKVGELILDWNLWPRYKVEFLDSTNITRMKQAIKAGLKLPSIIVNKADYRIIDGFHRVKVYRDLFGEEHDITVKLREFKNDAEMFMESARLNSVHGLPLSPQDKAHVILRARRFKYPFPVIAQIIGMDEDTLKKFYKSRIAKTKKGETLVLANGASDLSDLDRPLTNNEEIHARSANGCKASVNIALLLYALKADNVKLTEKTVSNLIQLKEEIIRILKKAGV